MKKMLSLTTLLALSMGPLVVSTSVVAQQPARGRRGGMRRSLESEVAMAIEALGLEPGMTLAEIGAGDGRFARRLAAGVRPGGRTYANELGAQRVRAISRAIAQEGLDDVFAVQGTVDDTNLPEGAVDALTMRMVYHMMTDPEAMNRSFFRTLKPGGTMLVIEGYPKDGPNAPGVPANRSGMGIDSTIAIAEIEAAGFELLRVIDRWPNVGYALLFRRPPQDRSSDGAEWPTLRTARPPNALASSPAPYGDILQRIRQDPPFPPSR